MKILTCFALGIFYAGSLLANKPEFYVGEVPWRILNSAGEITFQGIEKEYNTDSDNLYDIEKFFL
ncbi:MAG TPA: hypothetical protein VJ208_01285 [Candidatus Nanoarchaeia archaeon]|nr:hypothetical protein [Candidatus Nanoarchaeia archaeon]